MMNPMGFPLAGLLREVAEGHLHQAELHLEAAEKDVRLLIDGHERTGTFRPDTDAVTVLIDAAKQVSLCRTVLGIDDEAREEVAS
jgi:hypothetical protein